MKLKWTGATENTQHLSIVISWCWPRTRTRLCHTDKTDQSEQLKYRMNLFLKNQKSQSSCWTKQKLFTVKIFWHENQKNKKWMKLFHPSRCKNRFHETPGRSKFKTQSINQSMADFKYWLSHKVKLMYQSYRYCCKSLKMSDCVHVHGYY